MTELQRDMYHLHKIFDAKKRVCVGSDIHPGTKGN